MAKKLSIGSWAYCFGPYESNPIPFDTVVKTLAEYGVDGVEIGAFRPHLHPEDYPMKADRDKITQLIKDNGLEVSGLAADFWSYHGPGTDEAQKNNFYFNLFKKNLQLALDFGAPAIRVDTNCPPDGIPGVDRQVIWDRIVALWRKCAQIAQDFGVKLVWEFEPGFIFNKPSEVVQLVEAVDHPNFSVLFDACHAYMSAVVGARQHGEKETLAGGVVEFARMLKGKIGHIHLIDSDGTLHGGETSTHRPFGEGNINFDEVLPVLAEEIGYTSDWWTIDLCFWPEAWDVTRNAQEFLKPYLQRY
ncbi:MAG: sugar phosphate isomerase/epimerase [Candidatus Omnitrophota bacterium]|jgi:sugar phosphate isomerase/epimerase|nr:MAG: sugar phosphate isomerase/epimerase [Candidatus Omnitrophota bacterium]